ncbi:DNA-formamidopyrimidine glycosylase [Prochlorococcus sp. MIT 1341]|uniref:DNA-formamidopyrimidine glycosylase n=1 Tax=Prochlorococcus sp. MIT 1341 TaxID=3096221 RepID=UPI002A760BA2|nr:DNA-formamidopyrimidine glycosylase [Prochlorococcus sp. MIT 1341]
MPELPEVETVRKGLEDCLGNFCIHNVEVLRDRAIASPGGSSTFIKKLKGKTFGEWKRRGKYLLASLYKTNLKNSPTSSYFYAGSLGVHLRMTGYFQWNKNPSEPCKHTRVRFWNEQGDELRFVDTRSFGQLWWVPPGQSIEEVITGLKSLGPEPFSSSFTTDYLKNKLMGSKRAIKSSLLDQSIVAGVGNIYSDESLFLSCINPHQKAGSLNKKQLELLRENLIKVLELSIGSGGTTFSDFRDLEGVNGNYGGQAWVYKRKNSPCRKCGTEIIRDVISGRGTHWCPKCQS